MLYPVYTDTFYGAISKISVRIYIEVPLAIVSHDLRQGISIMYSALQLLAFLSVESRFSEYDFAYLNFQFDCCYLRCKKGRKNSRMVGILVTGYSCHPFLSNISKTFFPVLVILANIPENKYTYEV